MNYKLIASLLLVLSQQVTRDLYGPKHHGLLVTTPTKPGL